MRSLHTKAHTFASHTSPYTDQSLQKSMLFGNPERNSFFFSHPSVFYFFATHSRQKNRWTKTAKTQANSDLTMSEDRRPACNTGLAKVAVQCSADTFVVNQSLVLRISICGENRHLRQARKRCVQGKKTQHLTVFRFSSC